MWQDAGEFDIERAARIHFGAVCRAGKGDIDVAGQPVVDQRKFPGGQACAIGLLTARAGKAGIAVIGGGILIDLVGTRGEPVIVILRHSPEG
ncbi:hypothetical protein N8D56_23515 [Devosia sp. A8/3-2]|nr:hypothetical protein N8D56_23515 [Devosia sp. A8/3-2]